MASERMSAFSVLGGLGWYGNVSEQYWFRGFDVDIPSEEMEGRKGVAAQDGLGALVRGVAS